MTPDGFEAFVRAHRALGFTDFSIVPSDAAPPTVLERIAEERIPALRAEFGGEHLPER